MALAGDLITYTNPKWAYQNDYYLVLHGWTDQNGVNYWVCSLGYAKGQKKRAGRLSMTILDREAKVVGKLSGDEYYAMKQAYYDAWHNPDSKFLCWNDPEKAVYGAEPRS